MFQVPSTSGGAERREGGVESGQGSMNLTRSEPRRDPRCNLQAACPMVRDSMDTHVSTEVPEHVKCEQSPASPSDLDEVDSLMGDEDEAASMLKALAEEGSDTDAVSVCSWSDSLAALQPTLPALTVHVDNMTVMVREDRLTYQRTTVSPHGTVLGDL